MTFSSWNQSQNGCWHKDPYSVCPVRRGKILGSSKWRSIWAGWRNTPQKRVLKRWWAASRACCRSGDGKLCASGLFCAGDVLHRENYTVTAGDRAVVVPTCTVLLCLLRQAVLCGVHQEHQQPNVWTTLSWIAAMLQQQQQCWCSWPPGRAAATEQLGSKTPGGTRPVPPKGISAYSNATYIPRHAKLSETLICQQSSVYTNPLPAVGELISFHTLELHWQHSVGYTKPQSAGHVCIRFVGLYLILCIKGSWASPLSNEIIITPIVPSGHGDPVHTYPERQGIQSTPCWDRELLFRLVITCLCRLKTVFLTSISAHFLPASELNSLLLLSSLCMDVSLCSKESLHLWAKIL